MLNQGIHASAEIPGRILRHNPAICNELTQLTSHRCVMLSARPFWFKESCLDWSQEAWLNWCAALLIYRDEKEVEYPQISWLAWDIWESFIHAPDVKGHVLKLAGSGLRHIWKVKFFQHRLYWKCNFVPTRRSENSLICGPVLGLSTQRLFLDCMYW